MTSPAPRPLGDEWNQTFNRPWTKIGGTDGLGIRVHVTAVPGPATRMLMGAAAGLAALSAGTSRGPGRPKNKPLQGNG